MHIFFQGTNYELRSFSIYIIPKNFLKVKFFFDIFYIDKTQMKYLLELNQLLHKYESSVLTS